MKRAQTPFLLILLVLALAALPLTGTGSIEWSSDTTGWTWDGANDDADPVDGWTWDDGAVTQEP